MQTKQDQAPHEGLFIKIFKDLDNTRHFLKQHISQELQQYFDLDSLHLENTTYVDEKLKKHFSDLVFSIRLINQDFPMSRLYLLFEHKSSPEQLVGLQILRYMALQWKDLYDQNKLVGGKLPSIIPIVIYQGQEDWGSMRPSFQDLVDLPSEAFKVHIPDFSFAFFNVRGMDEKKVQEKILLKLYVEIIKMQNDPNIKGLPPRLVRGLLESLERRTALEYIEIFFKYLVKSTGHLDREDYEKALELLPEGGEKIMETLADQWMDQGAQNERQKAEEWIRQEKVRWIEQTKIEATQNHILENLIERFDVVGPNLTDKIKSIQFLDTLNALFRKTNRVNSLEEFIKLVDKAMES